MITNADILAEYLKDRQALTEHLHPDADHTFLSDDIGDTWPLLVLDAFLYLHCRYKRTEQYQRYRRWIEEMVVAGVQATTGIEEKNG